MGSVMSFSLLYLVYRLLTHNLHRLTPDKMKNLSLRSGLTFEVTNKTYDGKYLDEAVGFVYMLKDRKTPVYWDTYGQCYLQLEGISQRAYIHDLVQRKA